MNILVLGIGNLIMSDDAAGIRTVQLLQQKGLPLNVSVDTAALTGLNLLDLLEGYDQAILVDSMVHKELPVGTVVRFTAEELDHLNKDQYSHHNLGLVDTLKFGEQNGIEMPSQIIIYAICAENVRSFGESLSPEVQKGVEEACRLIYQELKTYEN